MDRYFAMEDYAYVNRSEDRRSYEVVDGATSKTVGSFSGGTDPLARAEHYADVRNGVA